MELNKIVGAFCASLLVFLGLGFFAEQVFYPHGPEELAFALAVEEDAGEEEAAPEVDLAALLAAADPAAGEGGFRKCAACHKMEDGANGVGPHLYRVVGREIGSVEGFKYSGALPAGEVWTPENLYAFLANPKGWAPGTSMGFAGLRNSEERAEMIVYLNEAGGAPIEFAAPAEEAAAEPAAVTTETPAAEEAATGEAATEEAPAADEAPADDAAAAEEAPADEQVAVAPAAPEEPAAEDAPAAGGMSPEMAAVFASADLAEGEKVFRKCRACHKTEDGANGVGPHLHGVVGRQIASVDGYRYSDALPADQAWTPENLYAYLEDPKGWAPGTKMAFAGLKTSQERANVIAWLNQQGDSPIPLE
ncbi:MAG: c-type cytochrome [Pikeienuella sp.]|uniref:c-type cytochrome n=1 Tax=Pikeienuella sp. TaxID=2831957 RepID=UPI00391B4280